MGTSRNTRKDDIVLMGGCGYYGAITKSSIQGPHCPPHHCPTPASAEVCGNDVNSEHGGGGDRDQPVAALDPRDTSVYCLQCLHIARVALALS